MLFHHCQKSWLSYFKQLKLRPGPVFDRRQEEGDDRGQGDADQGEDVQLLEVHPPQWRHQLGQESWKEEEKIIRNEKSSRPEIQILPNKLFKWNRLRPLRNGRVLPTDVTGSILVLSRTKMMISGLDHSWSWSYLAPEQKRSSIRGEVSH